MPHASIAVRILACLLFPAVAAAQSAPPQPPARLVTTYVPSAEVNAQARQRLAAELQRRDPNAAAKLEAAMQQQDFRDLWAKAVASDGLHPNDVADAVASYWVLNWLIVHGRTDNTTGQVQGTRRQVAGALAANAAFGRLDDAGKQRRG